MLPVDGNSSPTTRAFDHRQAGKNRAQKSDQANEVSSQSVFPSGLFRNPCRLYIVLLQKWVSPSRLLPGAPTANAGRLRTEWAPKGANVAAALPNRVVYGIADDAHVAIGFFRFIFLF